ncbi:MAG: acyltransferase domain-containing protein, partial [Microcystaceae cyanobacterium]
LPPVRAAIVATHPQGLTHHLETLKSFSIQNSEFRILNSVYLGTGFKIPRIGFLFPGQASPVYLNGGIWERRFPWLKDWYGLAALPTQGDTQSTAVAQPSIVLSSIVGLKLLAQLDITADMAVGHSLGELAALHWAGAMEETTLLRIAKLRGQAMAELGCPTGAMASIGAEEQDVQNLLKIPNSEFNRVVIAALNSPHQTIISGEAIRVNEIVEQARARGLKAVLLPVSHAFHSPLVAAASDRLYDSLAQENFSPLYRTVVSTITGSPLEKQADLRSLLVKQITAPVRFMEAIFQAGAELDLLIEVGPGRVLSGLVTDLITVPVVALDAGGASLTGLLQAVGAAFALGVPINPHPLFAERFTRPFNLDWQPRFFANPCELAPLRNSEFGIPNSELIAPPSLNRESELISSPSPPSPLDCVRQLVAQRVELPPEAVKNEYRLLSDLHLNSITVSQLVAEATRFLGLSPSLAPTNYADATVAEIAQALEELLHTPNIPTLEDGKQVPAGINSW